MRILKIVLRAILVVFGILVVGALGLVVWSWTMPEVAAVPLVSKPNPSVDYADAAVRFERLRLEEEALGTIDPKCLPTLLTHGEKTARAIVLLHGFTACPFQYHKLGQDFFDLGYNVYIPRLLYHGFADRTPNWLVDLTSEELLSIMDPSLDIAAGLGDEVTIAGLSLGGNVAATAGQLRADVELAVPMSPAYGLRFVPDFLSPALTRLILGLPDIYLWWDPINQDNFQAESGYPGYSSHALGQIFRLGFAIRGAAQAESPAAQHLLSITNWGDPAVNLSAAETVADLWRDRGGAVQRYRFPLLPWLPHDFISTDAVGAKIDVSYPKLLELISAFPKSGG